MLDYNEKERNSTYSLKSSESFDDEKNSLILKSENNCNIKDDLSSFFDENNNENNIFLFTYLNIFSVFVLNVSFYFMYFNNNKKENKNVFFLFVINSIFSILFIIKNIFINVDNNKKKLSKDIKKIILNHYYFFCVLSNVFLNVNFVLNLCDNNNNNNNNNNKILNIIYNKKYILITSLISFIFVFFSYYSHQKQIKNIFFENYFNYFSLSIFLDIFTSFNLIYLVDNLMRIFESIFLILLLTLTSVLLISYFNDYYFCIMSIFYQMNFMNFKFDDFDLLIVFSFVCFCVTIFTNLKYFNKFDVNINFNKNDDEEEIDIKNLYNKSYKQNFYDSI